MAKKVIWATVFAVVAIILQSTLLSRLSVYIHAVPDIALVILVFTAYVNGTTTGQLTGFCSGLLMDFLSAAPLGLNAFIRTILGALGGFMNGSFFLDTLFLPMVLCAGATLLKALLLYALHILFAGEVAAYGITEPTLWVELVLNTLSAPFLFAFLKLFKPLLAERRES
ncbi:MAG: rod shape-determining protein MreD [Treponema sp.]|jgi:rod shape-determining protein MreD|nr:rod shape-determining protein MreD [Treponema sp.]